MAARELMMALELPSAVPATLGVILAGGLSRRMGGGDKALLDLAGRPLLAHVIERFRPQVDCLVLNANGDRARFAAFGLEVVPDGLPDYPGPLAGVLAALDHAAIHHPATGWVVSVSADGPFLPLDLVARLHEARVRADLPLACAASGDFTHPTIGLWQVSLRHDLRRALTDEGLRKIDRWTARHGCAAISWTAEPVDPFFNANTPEELRDAEAMAKTLHALS